MGDVRSEARDQIHFHCRECRYQWEARPARVAEAPERAHPWLYFAPCPRCGDESEQAHWEKGLFAAIGKQTGPRTPEGKAVSAANLAGHPTPEEARITRFNALKHGLSAQVATFWPARPGKYAQCEGCQHLYSRDCERFKACLSRAELFLKFHVAFENGDPVPLRELMANTQAGLHALIQDMILTITQDGGPRLKTPDWYHDKDGGFHWARGVDHVTGEQIQIYKLEQHPLLKPLIDYVSKNSTTLADMEMTPRQQTQEKQLQGYLNGEKEEKESALEFQRRQTEALEGLRGMIDRSRARISRDPVLLEHQSEEGEDG